MLNDKDLKFGRRLWEYRWRLLRRIKLESTEILLFIQKQIWDKTCGGHGLKKALKRIVIIQGHHLLLLLLCHLDSRRFTAHTWRHIHTHYRLALLLRLYILMESYNIVNISKHWNNLCFEVCLKRTPVCQVSCHPQRRVEWRSLWKTSTCTVMSCTFIQTLILFHTQRSFRDFMFRVTFNMSSYFIRVYEKIIIFEDI